MMMFPPNSTLLRDLAEYIQDESSDSLYYRELAQIAPTAMAKQLLTEFSQDEARHADQFKQAYALLAGQPYMGPVPQKPEIPPYCEAVRRRVLAETTDYKKYGQQYLAAPNRYLANLFFMTRTDEATHAMRMPLVFCE